MIQGGSPGRLLHQSGCGGLFFLCPGEAPGGAGDGLQHIAAKLNILSENFVIFPYCKYGGGGTMKMRNTLNKEVQKAQENENVEKERRPLP